MASQQHLDWQDYGKIPKVSEWKGFRSSCLQKKSEGITVFTQAHIVVGFDRYIETMNRLSRDNGKMIREVSQEILKSCLEGDKKGRTALEGCFLAVREIKNVGDFFANQITCDLLESQCLGLCTENDWTKLGPGARVSLRTETPRISFC